MDFPFRHNFPNAKRTYDELLSNVSIIFTLTHFSSNGPRPNLPNMIEVGGMHVKEKPSPLPEVRTITPIIMIKSL
jgi:glucuronosyltransferase